MRPPICSAMAQGGWNAGGGVEGVEGPVLGLPLQAPNSSAKMMPSLFIG